MISPKLAIGALRSFGLRWLVLRGCYLIRARVGMLKARMPREAWSTNGLPELLRDSSLLDPRSYLEYRRSRKSPFFFDPESMKAHRNLFDTWDEKSVNPEESAERLLKGCFRYFEHHEIPLGFPPDWHRNAFTGESAPSGMHWSEIPDFGFGDIKAIWEPSRFSLAFTLVRAYWRSGDERYAEAFWQLVEDWRRKNPPNSGPNWKCGQEISFRVMAWCFGLYGFLDAKATSSERVGMLAEMIAVSGKRIEKNLEYALSQRNNHGISEGLGLFTIGILFPELRDAARWEKKGRGVLEQLGRSLIHEDGSFVQHSANYHRLMLHDYVWVLRLGDLAGRPFSLFLKDRVLKATLFLYQIQDQTTGRVPNYGQNDGAFILPLSNCDFLDFRPVIQSAYYQCKGNRCYEPGPWDEDLLWLFGPSALSSLQSSPELEDLIADDGGCYTIRSDEGLVFTRCTTFKERPSQADMLHVDLWWKGQNIALDPGTYSYNAPPPWNNSLAHTAYHNTVSVDGVDQMERIGRFLWFPWIKARARTIQRSDAGNLAYWEGRHNGYERLPSPVRHARGILQLPGEHWLILDYLESCGPHVYLLHWLLFDFEHEWNDGRLELRTPEGVYSVRVGIQGSGGTTQLWRACQEDPRGWWCPRYYHKEPAISLETTLTEERGLFWSLLGPGDFKVGLRQDCMSIQGPSLDIEVWLRTSGDVAPLISRALVRGRDKESLEIS